MHFTHKIPIPTHAPRAPLLIGLETSRERTHYRDPAPGMPRNRERQETSMCGIESYGKGKRDDICIRRRINLVFYRSAADFFGIAPEEYMIRAGPAALRRGDEAP
ncbi:MAG: hypothetical protein P8182_18415 [Deltaproteobacteria bacterium]